MSTRVLLPLFAFLASCSPQKDMPVAAVLKEGGAPVGWKIGSRILVEGKIYRTGEGDFLILNRTGTGRLATDNCGIIREAQLSPLSWRKILLAYTGWKVAVIGRSTELFPSYPTPRGGQHQRHTCLFAIEEERIEIR